MGRKSPHNLPPGIHLDAKGVYWATLEGEDAKLWRQRNPGRGRPPRRQADSLREALRQQRRLVEELRAGRDLKADNPQVAGYVEKWIAQRQKLAPSTRRRYEQSHRYQIKPLKLGRLKLHQLTREHVREWVADLVRQCRQDDEDETLDAHSIRNAFAVLRAALNTAVTDGLIPFNPCRGVELPRSDDEEITPLTPEEVDTLLRLIDAYEVNKATETCYSHRLAAFTISATPTRRSPLPPGWSYSP